MLNKVINFSYSMCINVYKKLFNNLNNKQNNMFCFISTTENKVL